MEVIASLHPYLEVNRTGPETTQPFEMALSFHLLLRPTHYVTCSNLPTILTSITFKGTA